jgi:uncharacterized protein (TIGR02001 family)
MRATALLPLALLTMTAAPAMAQEMTLYGGLALEYAIEPYGPGSENQADLEGYVEMELASGIYAGIWAQKSDDKTADEVDLYLGYRSETAAGLAWDVSYWRYFYPNAGGDCCGELALTLGYGLSDRLYGTFDLAYDPEYSLANSYVGLAYTLTDAWELSVNYGFYEVDAAPTETEWDVGATWYFGEESAIDLRWYEGSDYDGYVALFLSWDTTILSR